MKNINRMPLSDSQMGIYLECVNNEKALQYNITFEYQFGKDVDASKLRDACICVLANYADGIFLDGITRINI